MPRSPAPRPAPHVVPRLAPMFHARVSPPPFYVPRPAVRVSNCRRLTPRPPLLSRREQDQCKEQRHRCVRNRD